MSQVMIQCIDRLSQVIRPIGVLRLVMLSFVFFVLLRKKVVLCLQHRGVEQLVARWAHNPKVVSSSLTPATRIEAALRPLFYVLGLCSIF